ncbi:MAG: DNA-binding transcriptional regulator [Verrucomicrobia bacterium]|nr:DNA-binding transcriptional regulator [Verrucomicrobiota bacterium]
MTTKRTVLLALTSSSHHGFFRGIARYAREHHWHLVADMIYTAKIPAGWRGDGIISFIGYRDDLAEFILASGLPTVELSMTRNEIQLPRVEGDNNMIGCLAAEHFLERGYRHFAWAPMLDDAVNDERHCGFGDRLAKAGFICHLLPPADTCHGDPSTRDWATRRKVLMRELKRLPKPLAVFGYNDCVAADIIDACNNAGLLVPEAVAVLGVDNDALICESIPVPLSSVCHNLEGMAYEAAALLDRVMSGRKPPKEVIRVHPKGLMIRRSTDILAVEDLQVARALRFLRDNYTNPQLSVSDVVAATNRSRRLLEKAFRRELQCTINDEIVRLRINKVKDLLTNSDMKVVDISAVCGFSLPNYLFRSFRKRAGVSPKTYRANQLAAQREFDRLRQQQGGEEGTSFQKISIF